MSHTCEWRIAAELERAGSAFTRKPWIPAKPQIREIPCGKPANFLIDWGDGVVYWYCAEHYERRIQVVRDAGRDDVLRRSG